MKTADYFRVEPVLLPVQELSVPIGWQAKWVPDPFCTLRIGQKSRSIASNQAPTLHPFCP